MAPVILYRARRMAGYVVPYVREGGSLLDVGCGNGLILHEIHRQTGVSIQGVDVLPDARAPVPVVVYDGRRLPFPDNAFDQVLLSFILHHCEDPILVLKEAIRVARADLIVIEDIAEDRFGRWVAEAHDWFVNKITVPDMNLPYRFKSTREWSAIFGDLGLAISDVRAASSMPLVPVRQTLFLLEKHPFPREQTGQMRS